MITSKPRLLAVIGDPVFHSLSPRIHNYFAEKTGADYVYTAFHVKPSRLAEFTQAALSLGISGFNATMPHKESLLPLVFEIDETAARLGAVNTVVNRGGRLVGYNTDGGGFMAGLHAARPTLPETALILGAGGAAKAVAEALSREGVRVTVASRRAVRLFGDNAGISYARWDDLTRLSETSELVVNATPLGMDGVAGQFESFDFLSALPANALVYDLIYSPPETELLRRAAARGLAAMNGLRHLVSQAALSFELFTGFAVTNGDIEEITKILEG